MMFEEESIMRDIEQVLNRMEIYDKKNSSMGLSTSEEQLYAKLAVKYVKLRLCLFDSVFDKYILPEVLNEEIIEFIKEIYDSIGWDLNILVESGDMDVIYNRYKENIDRDEILNKIKRFHKIIRKRMISEYVKLEDREIWECISILISDGESKKMEILLSHLDYKFESIYMLLEEEEV